MTAEVRAPQNLYALKDKDTFIVADQFGDIAGQGDGLLPQRHAHPVVLIA
ncbi:hypothetical protein ACRAWD_11580 [Caulobacter segnis]